MEKPIFERYKIIKTLDEEDNTSVYLVEDIETKENYIIRKLPTDTTHPLYDTAIKEFEDIGKKSLKIDKNTFAPAIIDFFLQEGNSYLLLEYKDKKSLKRVQSYPSIGKILNNRYVAVNGIAMGGFGAVYLVRDLNLPGKYWALKEMQEESQETKILEKSFKIEAEMLSTLEHPSIPRISDFFIEDNKFYLVMDYVKGETLKKMIFNLKEGEKFPEDKVIPWALSICDVLYYLHNRPTPVVFRDLKPDNIIITTEGEAKLIDFGIAKVLQGNKIETTLHPLLTAGYAPPEQWMGKAEPRSDIYSFGATIYHLLSGVHPKTLTRPFPPVEEFNITVTPLLSKIISKCLAPELNDRYSSIIEVKKDMLKLHTKKDIEELVRAHLSRGMKYETEGDFYNANFEYMSAMKFDEENYEILMGIGGCCEKLGFNEKAIHYYNRALNTDMPENIRLRIRERLKLLYNQDLSEKTDIITKSTHDKIREDTKGPRIRFKLDDNKNIKEIKVKKSNVWINFLLIVLFIVPFLLLFFFLIIIGIIWLFDNFFI